MAPENLRYDAVNKLLTRAGPMQTDIFEPDPENLDDFDFAKVLVVGAGGLGCELLKDLALIGFKNIAVIDMDTIDLSNLNRQFLFRHSDVGSSKAEVAARFIMERVSGVTVTPFNARIESFDSDFYRQFHVIVLGLDSIPARQWMNKKVHQLVCTQTNGDIDETTIIPIVDGGTEGFKGGAQVIHPTKTHCFECMIDQYPETNTVQLCTLATKPRTPAHCVFWAQLVHWPAVKPFGEIPVDGDNVEHIKWVTENGIERGKPFGITGIDFRLAQGYVKNIIPAVASTNAMISAMCAQEVWKLITGAYKPLSSQLMLNGVDGVYMSVFKIEQKPDCSVCSNLPILFEVPSTIPLMALRDMLTNDPRTKWSDPQLLHEGKHLFYKKGQMNFGKENEFKILKDLFTSPAILTVHTDMKEVYARIEFSDIETE